MKTEETFSQVWREAKYPDYFTLDSEFIERVIYPAMEKHRQNLIDKIKELAKDENWQQNKFGRDTMYCNINEIINILISECQ